MSEDINKHLLSKFYGFNEDSEVIKFVSSSKGIESFENATDIEYLSTEHLLSSDETGKNQKSVKESNKIYDENKEGILSKSPHILTVEELLEESEPESPEYHSETDIIGDVKDDKHIHTKNFTRLEDTFTKAMAKISENPAQSDKNSAGNNTNSNGTFDPVTKAKKLWRQKTMISKENLLTCPDFLSKFNGIHLDLNNAGIYTFPIDILQQLKSLQMLYVDSNHIKEIPNEFFTILKNLKWLDLRNNQLTTIPKSIKGHASLQTLLIQGNNIKALPLELGLIPNLKNLQTAHNPLVFPPKEILDSDCSKIINFLRNKWNKENPNEIIELKKVSDGKTEKKPSTIICYQPNSKKSFRNNSYRSLQSMPKTSVRLRAWNYKPSNRCQSAGGNVAYEQKMLWMKTAKELLHKQAVILQKSIDKNLLVNWRRNYKSYKNKQNDSINYLLEPPFALHVETSKSKDTINQVVNSKSKSGYLNSRNFVASFNDFVESLKKLDDGITSGNMTPPTEQKKLQAEIEKIIDLQRKLQDLKFYNDSVIAPYTGLDNASKNKYVPPPSIII